MTKLAAPADVIAEGSVLWDVIRQFHELGLHRAGIPHAVACKCLSTETAFHVAGEAVQILAGNGLSREYPIEKIFRDARASMIEAWTLTTIPIWCNS